ncbi:UNVERIFIED_CONTAM: hypothetical protein GTU68_025976 [Idotea baltica]|nr:hypothetical protein [Idotea baltica]
MFPLRSCPDTFVPVFCNQTTDGGGWTVIQRRADLPQREDFFRDWAAYQRGFGNLTGEFWLGLDNIHALVSQTPMELRVDLEDFEGEKRWAKYNKFFIEDSAGNYKLTLGEYSGDAGESLSVHDGMPFSARDKDNDRSKTTNCAESFKGAWWYNSCHQSNLNGFQYKGPDSPSGKGIVWYKFRGLKYSLKSTSLSVRPLEGK